MDNRAFANQDGSSSGNETNIVTKYNKNHNNPETVALSAVDDNNINFSSDTNQTLRRQQRNAKNSNERSKQSVGVDNQGNESDIQSNLSEVTNYPHNNAFNQEDLDDSWKRSERDILRECSNNPDKKASLNEPLQVISAQNDVSVGVNDNNSKLDEALTTTTTFVAGDELINISDTRQESQISVKFTGLDNNINLQPQQHQLAATHSAVTLNLAPTQAVSSSKEQQHIAPQQIQHLTATLINQSKFDNFRTSSSVIKKGNEAIGSGGRDLIDGSPIDRPSSSEFVDCDSESPQHVVSPQTRSLLDRKGESGTDQHQVLGAVGDRYYSSESDIDSDVDVVDHQKETRHSKSGKYISISKLGSNNRRSKYNPKSLTGNISSRGGGILNHLKSTFNFSDSRDPTATTTIPYLTYEDKDLLTGNRKYNLGRRKGSTSRTFRGSYRYTRVGIGMAILNKLSQIIFRRSSAALLGAFLIHITLGTVYTLSNINSYLTSYMRKHGYPNATYGSSMWISSSYAIGQGLSMVLGGYIEKRFSARISCILGCATHSLAIMSTSVAIDHGPLAVLLTYGFLPGFGCGLAYMTPMSNGFGWFPNRRGLVAGTILAGFGIGTFVFNMAQTAYVNPDNLSPPKEADGYFTQNSILNRVPHLFIFIGSIYAIMQFIGCCLLFKPPNSNGSGKLSDERPILAENEIPLQRAIRTREFLVLFIVFGTTNQGVLFVNSMLKEYGQIYIGSDMYLAWTGSMASIANSLGRLAWGLAIDRFSFTQCFSCITVIFGSLMFIMPFKFILSSKTLYLLCTLGIFGSFSGWMSTYPVHISRVFGRTNSGMVYGLIFVSQAIGGVFTALGAHYLIDHYSRFVPFFCVTFLELLGLLIYHLFYPK